MAARFWVGGSGTWNNSSTTNWSATSGGASGASAPTTADTATFDANSGAAATVSVAATAATSACTVNKADINLSLAGSPTFTGLFTLTTGTVTLGSFTLSCLTFNSSNSNTRTLAFGTGSITLTGNNATLWNTDTPTNLTVTGTPTVNATYSGATGTRVLVFSNAVTATEAQSININVTAGADTVTLYGSGMQNINFTGFSGTWSATGASKKLFGSLTLSSTMTLAAGIGTFTFAATSGTKTITTNGLTIDGAMTFNGVGGTFQFADALTMGSTRAFTITNGTVKLKNGTTNTVGSFTTGAGTTQRILQSTVAGSQATITDPSGTNAATYLTVQDIAAAGGATWNAFAANNNVDAGNNSGWNFGLTPQYAYEYPIELRSFTERKRF